MSLSEILLIAVGGGLNKRLLQYPHRIMTTGRLAILVRDRMPYLHGLAAGSCSTEHLRSSHWQPVLLNPIPNPKICRTLIYLQIKLTAHFAISPSLDDHWATWDPLEGLGVRSLHAEAAGSCYSGPPF